MTEKVKNAKKKVETKVKETKAKAAKKKPEKKEKKISKILSGTSHEDLTLELAKAGVEPDKIIEILKTLKN